MNLANTIAGASLGAALVFGMVGERLPAIAALSVCFVALMWAVWRGE